MLGTLWMSFPMVVMQLNLFWLFELHYHIQGVNLSARRLLLLSVVRPTLENGSEVWEESGSCVRISYVGWSEAYSWVLLKDL